MLLQSTHPEFSNFVAVFNTFGIIVTLSVINWLLLFGMTLWDQIFMLIEYVLNMFDLA